MQRKRFTVIGGRMSFLNIDYTIIENHEELMNYSDKELSDNLEAVRFANKQITTENEVFLRYLSRNDPESLSGLESDPVLNKFVIRISKVKEPEEIEEKPAEIEVEEPISVTKEFDYGSKIRSNISSRIFQTQSLKNLGSRASLMSADRGPKININIKTDMVDKEMDALIEEIENIKVISTFQFEELSYQIQEANLMLQDIINSQNKLDLISGKNNINNVVPTITTEKWIHYMNNWFKHTDTTMNQLRLNNVTSKDFLIRTNKTLAEKEILVKSFKQIDFEELRIKNKIFKKTYDLLTKDVYNLKKSTGKTNLQLTYHKKCMLGQMKEIATLKDQIKKSENKIQDVKRKGKSAEKEMINAKHEFFDLKINSLKYNVRSMNEYADAKQKLIELKKELKKWQTQSEAQKIAIQTCFQTLKVMNKEMNINNIYLK